jgi:hypothetical protein
LSKDSVTLHPSEKGKKKKKKSMHPWHWRFKICCDVFQGGWSEIVVFRIPSALRLNLSRL